MMQTRLKLGINHENLIYTEFFNGALTRLFKGCNPVHKLFSKTPLNLVLTSDNINSTKDLT